MLLYIGFNMLFGNSIISKHTPRCNIYCEEDLNLSLIPPSGGELKLLTNLNAESWSYNWITMISSDNTQEYDEHYYMDLFNMRGMANMYTSEKYFYMGFFPDSKFCNNGPKYIGLFELDYINKVLDTKIIVENPHYIDDDSTFHKFRDAVKKISDESQVTLNYMGLNRPGQIRFYYLWNLN